MAIEIPNPELEKRLAAAAAQAGRPADDLAQDAIAGYLTELAETREMLDSRYDDIESGSVKFIPGEEAFARLHERIDARRNGGDRPFGSDLRQGFASARQPRRIYYEFIRASACRQYRLHDQI